MIIRHETLAETVVDTNTVQDTSLAKQDEIKRIPATGFHTNPERINRKGRPKKGSSLTDIAKDVLEEQLPSGVTRKEALVKKVAQLAYDGNETMIKLLWNYVDGMPVQKQEVTGKDGKPLPTPILGVANAIYTNNSN